MARKRKKKKLEEEGGEGGRKREGAWGVQSPRLHRDERGGMECVNGWD